MNFPFKFSVNFTLENKEDVVDFVKFVNYQNKFSRQAGSALLNELGIDKYIEVSVPKIKKPIIKEERYIDDMPF
jgi:hypothetical protein